MNGHLRPASVNDLSGSPLTADAGATRKLVAHDARWIHHTQFAP